MRPLWLIELLRRSLVNARITIVKRVLCGIDEKMDDMPLSPENGTGEGPLLRLIPRIAPPNDGIVLKNPIRGVAESEPAPGTRRNRAREGESGAGWRVGWGQEELVAAGHS